MTHPAQPATLCWPAETRPQTITIGITPHGVLLRARFESTDQRVGDAAGPALGDGKPHLLAETGHDPTEQAAEHGLRHEVGVQSEAGEQPTSTASRELLLAEAVHGKSDQTQQGAKVMASSQADGQAGANRRERGEQGVGDAGRSCCQNR